MNVEDRRKHLEYQIDFIEGDVAQLRLLIASLNDIGCNCLVEETQLIDQTEKLVWLRIERMSLLEPLRTTEHEKLNRNRCRSFWAI